MLKDRFFKKMEMQALGLSFEDVLLKPRYNDVRLNEIIFESKFSRNVSLKFPLVSSPMDTVTTSKMAIAMAKEGCLGIIHQGLTPKEQAAEVARVKFHLNGLIRKPITVLESETMQEIKNRIAEKEYSFHSFPVIDNDGWLVGIITNNDFDFCDNLDRKVGEVMSRELITTSEGMAIEKVFSLMRSNKKKLLPVLDSDGRLSGMYVYSDVRRIITGGSPNYNLDKNGNFRVGAAIGVGEKALERADLLVRKGIDVLVIDTSHGDSRDLLDTLRELKATYSDVDVVAGNISNGDAAKRLVDAGADGLRVGIGPGSICSTRVISGVGEPQLTAIYNCSKAVRGSGVPVCGDGGIKQTGHISLAIAAGADCVMLGSMLAGTEETPGQVIQMEGRPVKIYRGMGSIGAMHDSRAAKERYMQADKSDDKVVPEGVEGVVSYKGEVALTVFQCIGGLRSGMGHLGAANIPEFQEHADFHRITSAGVRESHPHSIVITKEAPNYRL